MTCRTMMQGQHLRLAAMMTTYRLQQLWPWGSHTSNPSSVRASGGVCRPALLIKPAYNGMHSQQQNGADDIVDLHRCAKWDDIGCGDLVTVLS
jgi:hypothetical protein